MLPLIQNRFSHKSLVTIDTVKVSAWKNVLQTTWLLVFMQAYICTKKLFMIVFTSIARTTQWTTDQHHPVLHFNSYHHMYWITPALQIAKQRQQCSQHPPPSKYGFRSHQCFQHPTLTLQTSSRLDNQIHPRRITNQTKCIHKKWITNSILYIHNEFKTAVTQQCINNHDFCQFLTPG